MSPLGRKDDPGRERTAEEREQERLERERRRAERAKAPPPAAPPPPTAASPPVTEGTGPSVTPPRSEPLRALSQDTTEEPLGTRRATRTVAPPAPAPRPRGLPRGRRGARRALLVALLAVIAGAVWFAAALFQPFAGDGGGRVEVVIPRGAGASQIGDILAERGVVSSSFFFSLRARLSGERDDLKSGTFQMRGDMSYAAALDQLTQAPPPPKIVRLTIPEGRSRREIAPVVRDAGLEGDYLAASQTSQKLRPSRYGAPRGTRTLEGFLFPATYELRPGATARRFVGLQLSAFLRTFEQLDLRPARRRNLNPYDVLIIASMVEREAGIDKDRRLISAVIHNRLRQHMPLGIDATIRYRMNNWNRPLRVSELNIASAYNTRRRQGLPPTPIGNPGLKSIQAAIRPARVPYLFYVVKPCGNGAHAFSASDEKFQRDVAAYNKARDERGGNDPSRC